MMIVANMAIAQFQIDLGATIAISNSKQLNFMVQTTNQGIPQTSFQSYKISAAGEGIFSYPKFHLSEFMGHSISVGLPISLGVTSNSQTGESAFLYDMNMAADINGGRLNKKSDDNMDKLIGYYAGLGFGITNTDVGYESTNDASVTANTKNIIKVNGTNGENVYDFMTGKSVGLLIHGGVTVPYRFDRDNSSNMGLRLFVKPAFGKNQVTYFGGSVFISFGKYTETRHKKKTTTTKKKH